MLTWRKRNNLSHRYVQNINNVHDKVSKSEEEKTSAKEKPVGSVFIFNFAVAKLTMGNELITARTAHLAQVQDQASFVGIFVHQNKFCHLVCHMSHPWLFSHAPSSMSIFLFFTYLSYHTTRTLSTSSTSPSSLSRQIAPSRITVAWRPAEWRKPAHNNSYRLWAQRVCDRLKDRNLFWRSMSIIWCTGKFWRRRSPSSYHRRSGGI